MVRVSGDPLFVKSYKDLRACSHDFVEHFPRSGLPADSLHRPVRRPDDPVSRDAEGAASRGEFLFPAARQLLPSEAATAPERARFSAREGEDMDRIPFEGVTRQSSSRTVALVVRVGEHTENRGFVIHHFTFFRA